MLRSNWNALKQPGDKDFQASLHTGQDTLLHLSKDSLVGPALSPRGSNNRSEVMCVLISLIGTSTFLSVSLIKVYFQPRK